MFPETRWTLIAAATMNGDESGKLALEALCKAYWPAVVQFLEGRGQSHEEAEDIAQEFFAALIASRLWQRADQTRGRFRSFLLGALMRVVIHHERQRLALKRGSGSALLDIDSLPEIAAPESDEQLVFDRAWAERVLENALEALEDDWPQPAEFMVLQRFLPVGDDPPAYEAAARQLDCSMGAFKSRVLRFRARFRELIEAQVARTVNTPHEIADELLHLERILAHPGFETSHD
jgi:RNA polymerase sigma-70 factor (ECF subfamily)